MNFRLLIFTSGIFSCTSLFPQDSALKDSVQELRNPDTTGQAISLPDSIQSWPWISDTALGVLSGTYTVFVVEPNPCIELSDYPPIMQCQPPIVNFIELGPDHVSWWDNFDPWSFTASIGGGFPYENWRQINLLDTTHQHFSRIGIAATRAIEISSDPPTKTPEPTKPVPIPRQQWYEAVLPARRGTRISALL